MAAGAKVRAGAATAREAAVKGARAWAAVEAALAG